MGTDIGCFKGVNDDLDAERRRLGRDLSPEIDDGLTEQQRTELRMQQAYALAYGGVKTPIVNILVIGDSCVGKTSLINCFMQEKEQTKASEYSTHGLVQNYIKTIRLDNHDPVKLQITDTAVSMSEIGLLSSLIRNLDVVVLCFSLTNRKSFYELERLAEQIEQIRESADGKKTLHFAMIGTKADLTVSER